MAIRPGDTGHNKSSSPARTIERTALDAGLTTISEWALRIGVAALALSAIYLAYGRFFGPAPGAAIAQADRLRFFQNHQLALRLLVWGAGLSAAAAAYLLRGEEATGYALAVIGALAYFGAPSAAGLAAPLSDPAFVAAGAAAAMRIGVLCLAPAALLIMYDASYRAREAWTGRRRSRTVAVSSDAIVLEKLPGPPLHCWQTHYCRPAVREFCPRFIEGAPCWRRKEGCFCEEKIALRAAALKEGSAGVYQEVRRSLDGANRNRLLTPAQKRERCRVCPIYSEHQRFKYKALVPIAFAATAAVMWWSAGSLHHAIGVSLRTLDTLMAQFSFTPGEAPGGVAQPSLPQGLTEAIDSGIVFAAVLAFLTIMLLTWLLRLVEYLIFKAQV